MIGLVYHNINFPYPQRGLIKSVRWPPYYFAIFDWMWSREIAITVGLTIRIENTVVKSCENRAEVFPFTVISRVCARKCASRRFLVGIELGFKHRGTRWRFLPTWHVILTVFRQSLMSMSEPARIPSHAHVSWDLHASSGRKSQNHRLWYWMALISRIRQWNNNLAIISDPEIISGLRLWLRGISHFGNSPEDSARKVRAIFRRVQLAGSSALHLGFRGWTNKNDRIWGWRDVAPIPTRESSGELKTSGEFRGA